MANVLAGAFVATIGSKKRLREVDQEEDDASTDGKLSAAKRLKKSAEHVSNPDTVASSMSQAVRSVPLDKLFNTFFEQEEIASDAIAEKSSACPEDHPKALLLQALSDAGPDGLLTKVEKDLAALLEPQSDLSSLPGLLFPGSPSLAADRIR